MIESKQEPEKETKIIEGEIVFHHISLQEVEQALLKKDVYCWNCKTPVKMGNMRHYQHHDGYVLAGHEKRQWIYYQCYEKYCEYQTSLQKFQDQIETRSKESLKEAREYYRENYSQKEKDEVDNPETEYEEDELWIAVPPIPTSEEDLF